MTRFIAATLFIVFVAMIWLDILVAKGVLEFSGNLKLFLERGRWVVGGLFVVACLDSLGVIGVARHSRKPRTEQPPPWAK